MLTFLVSGTFDGKGTFVGTLSVTFDFSGNGGLIFADKLSHVCLRTAMFDAFFDELTFEGYCE